MRSHCYAQLCEFGRVRSLFLERQVDKVHHHLLVAAVCVHSAINAVSDLHYSTLIITLYHQYTYKLSLKSLS